nr:photosystem I P700 apoprotein A2 [Melastoma malabathricum]WFQ82145.1 photosystem I P700 apoprotein A2 [Melastoma malabathricum]
MALRFPRCLAKA